MVRSYLYLSKQFTGATLFIFLLQVSGLIKLINSDQFFLTSARLSASDKGVAEAVCAIARAAYDEAIFGPAFTFQVGLTLDALPLQIAI